MSAVGGAGIVLPEEFARTYYGNNEPDGLAWSRGLPELAARCVERWNLRVDRSAEPRFGNEAVVVPVLLADGRHAVLKLQRPGDETRGEPLVLRAWNGAGAVRLLEHDDSSGSMLLERLDASRPLTSVPDDVEAARIIAGLLVRLHAVPPPESLPTLGDAVARMLAAAPARVGRLASDEERALLLTCADAVREVADEPGDRLLHWDLHYDNVLAALPGEQERERGPWLAIDPKPLVGDPGFDLLPALFNRWDEAVASGDAGRAVLRRFDAMTELMGLDRARARRWTLARVLQNTLWTLQDGGTAFEVEQACIARAMLGRG